VAFDALLVISFGGPEGPDDVVPFLRNVTRGRDIPEARLQAVASHYQEFGGISPINGHTRALVAALATALEMPVYWGNRNWHPLLADTVRRMREDGVKRAAAFATSAYASYSSCRQYLEDIAAARAEVGPGAPDIVKIPPYFDQPGFITPLAEGLRQARSATEPEAPVLMTAHSIPQSMAAACDYEAQLRRTASLVAKAAGEPDDRATLVFQSRSGPPDQAWLGPEIEDVIDTLPPDTRDVIVVPIGFVSDHMEVVYDLDRLATRRAEARGLRLLRVATPGTHPAFVAMITELTRSPVPCRPGCCPAAAR
jgi:ferrochelatase